MANFTFVTYETEPATQSLALKKIIRSKAARSAAFSKAEPKSLTQNEANIATYLAKKSELDKRRLLRPTIKHTRTKTSDSITTGVSSDATTTSGSSSERSQLSRSPSSHASSILIEPVHPVLMIQPLLAERFSPLLTDFYLKCMAVDIPDLDHGRPGSLRSLWFPFAILHDGLLQIVFLLSGSCYTNETSTSKSQLEAVRPCLINLKQQALASIRRMIMDSMLNNSDQSIAAVTKMASYEAMYGTREAFDVHMGALRKLVDSRGGLANLGLEGLLERMVCWVDYNSACLLGSEAYFPEANALPKPIAFDPTFFIGGSEWT